MIEKTYASHTIGLESISGKLRAALLSFKKGRPQIDRLESILPNASADPHHLDKKSPLDLSGNALVISSLSSDETLVRPLEVKLKKEKDRKSVV